jgi:hypothetical protein
MIGNFHQTLKSTKLVKNWINIIFIANSEIYDKLLEIITANSRKFDPKLEEKKIPNF